MDHDVESLPQFQIRPLSNAEGGGYLIEFPDFPGCMADGETPEEAVREGRDALKSFILTHQQLGRPIPSRPGDGKGGQPGRRATKPLLAALERRASREGVPLVALLSWLLSEALARHR